MSQTVTHKDLARKLKVSETTIKSYRRKFADCIPVASNGKPIRFLPQALEVCTRIRDLFELGMSIPEVRSRLAEEFSWISEQPPKPGMPEAPFKTTLPREYSIAMSSLAKSMVTLLKQQGEIKNRLTGLEQTLEHRASLAVNRDGEGGFNAESFSALLENLQTYLRNALMPLQHLQRLTEVATTADLLSRAAQDMAGAAQALRASDNGSSPAPTTSGSRAKILPFSTATSQPSASWPKPESTAIPYEYGVGPHTNPPREFLQSPMVVKSTDGSYMAAGGKLRGRFTLNDLKALLVYNKSLESRYDLRWEQAGSDWLAIITGGREHGLWSLRLREARSQSGVGVVELAGFSAQEEELHPAQFCAFVNSLAQAQ